MAAYAAVDEHVKPYHKVLGIGCVLPPGLWHLASLGSLGRGRRVGDPAAYPAVFLSGCHNDRRAFATVLGGWE